MKNFDIENLERKNIFRTPDHFFDEIQKNVLQETVYKQDKEVKSGKVFKLNWAYAAAAAMAMIFGITYFIGNDEEVQPTKTLAVANKVENNEVNAEKEIPLEIIPEEIVDEKTYANVDEVVPAENASNLTSVPVNYQRTAPAAPVEAPKAIASAVVETKMETANNQLYLPEVAEIDETMMDEVLSSFTYAELQEATNNTEQDIYLDLYN